TTAAIAAPTTYASGLILPSRAAIKEGSPKMLAPIIVFSMSAANPHRPTARTRVAEDFSLMTGGIEVGFLRFAEMSTRTEVRVDESGQEPSDLHRIVRTDQEKFMD